MGGYFAYFSWTSLCIHCLLPLGSKHETVREKCMLNLWLRASSMTVVNEMNVDLDGLRAGAQAAARPAEESTQDTEDEIIALVRADHAGGIASAASNKGYVSPFMNIIHMWWRQGSAQNLPLTFVLRRVNNTTVRCITARVVTHATAVRQLMASGRSLINSNESDDKAPVALTRVKVITAFSNASRYVVHAKYGNVWMRASKQPGLDKSSEAWWFLGTEIVQSLKAACGVRFISDPAGRYNNVSSLWEWVGSMGGWDWRKEYQIIPIAEELAKAQLEDENAVAQYAMMLAALTTSTMSPSDQVKRIATEANCVAALGLAVKANVRQLQTKLEKFCTDMTEILLNSENVLVENDISGAASIIASTPENWPEHDLALLIVNWISDAAATEGHPRAPAPTITSE